MNTWREERKREEDAVLDQATFEEGLVPEDLTPTQRRAIYRIYQRAEERGSNGGLGEVEPDEFNIRPVSAHSRRLSVFIRMRRTDLPENAIGNIFKTHGHFFVGPRGGIKSAELIGEVEWGMKKKLKKNPLIYGFSS